jgi:hypothetical protein
MKQKHALILIWIVVLFLITLLCYISTLVLILFLIVFAIYVAVNLFILVLATVNFRDAIDSVENANEFSRLLLTYWLFYFLKTLKK